MVTIIGDVVYLHLYPDALKEAQSILRKAYFEWIFGIRCWSLTHDQYELIKWIFDVGYVAEDSGFKYVACDAVAESEAGQLILDK